MKSRSQRPHDSTDRPAGFLVGGRNDLDRHSFPHHKQLTPAQSDALLLLTIVVAILCSLTFMYSVAFVYLISASYAVAVTIAILISVPSYFYPVKACRLFVMKYF
jgi:hypothetical protein